MTVCLQCTHDVCPHYLSGSPPAVSVEFRRRPILNRGSVPVSRIRWLTWSTACPSRIAHELLPLDGWHFRPPRPSRGVDAAPAARVRHWAATAPVRLLHHRPFPRRRP